MLHICRNLVSAISLLVMVLVLASCQGGIDSIMPKAEKPVPQKLVRKMKDKGMSLTSPILLRIYKTENKLEVWKEKQNGQFAYLTDYEICKWSGKLGPKFKEGDRQAPEGFYNVRPAQMNPKSSYHLSFNMGYPNTYDRSHGRTGSHLMVHGACSSAGCYSMTDEYVEEIYALARDSFRGGQQSFQIQAFPFKMTPENLANHVDNPHFEFWKLLKEGSDHFEVTKRPPKVDVCDRRYVFNKQADGGGQFNPQQSCPDAQSPTSLALAYTKKAVSDQDVFVKILSKQASSPFLSPAIREAAKRQAAIEKGEKEKLEQRQAMLIQKQQREVVEKQRELALAKAQKAEQEAIEAEKQRQAKIDAAFDTQQTATGQQNAPTEVNPVPVPSPEQATANANAGEAVPQQTTPVPTAATDGQTPVASPEIQIAEPVAPPPTLVEQVVEEQAAKPVKKIRKPAPAQERDR